MLKIKNKKFKEDPEFEMNEKLIWVRDYEKKVQTLESEM